MIFSQTKTPPMSEDQLDVRVVDELNAYMSGRMSGLPDDKASELEQEVYLPLKALTEDLGIACHFPFESRTSEESATDNEDMIWEIDYNLIAICDFVLAYMGIESFGVGMELEMARVSDVPVIMFCEESEQEKVSRLSKGSSATNELITYTEREEMLDKVGNEIIALMNEKNVRKVSIRDGWSANKRNSVLQRIRAEHEVAQRAIAHRHGQNGIFSFEEIREIGGEILDDESSQDTLF